MTHATQWLDNVVVVTPTVGVGAMVLGAVPSGVNAQTEVAAGAVDGSILTYRVDNALTWEVGYGAYTASGRLLARTVLYSSNANAPIVLTGAGVVKIVQLAEDMPGPTGPTGPTGPGLFPPLATAPTGATGVSYLDTTMNPPGGQPRIYGQDGQWHNFSMSD